MQFVHGEYLYLLKKTYGTFQNDDIYYSKFNIICCIMFVLASPKGQKNRYILTEKLFT